MHNNNLERNGLVSQPGSLLVIWHASGLNASFFPFHSFNSHLGFPGLSSVVVGEGEVREDKHTGEADEALNDHKYHDGLAEGREPRITKKPPNLILF